MSALSRYRGDTVPDQFIVKDKDGVAVDLTGATLVLTVNSELDPTDTSNQLFQLSGTITDAVNGEVEFEPSAANADQNPATYYYDVQMTDSGGRVRTLVVGTYTFVQDITK